jgi:hypothetical protein
MNPRHLVLFVILAWSPYILGALQTWDLATFEASPANSDQVSQGDDKIRELKENIRDRAEVEHLWGTISSGGDNGRSREGNARVFYDNSEPSALSNSVTDTAGSSALDEGRLWRDADDGNLKIYNGSEWVEAVTTLSGTIEFLNTPRFAGTSAGLDAYNPLAYALRNIVQDATIDTAGCLTSSGFTNTNLASQVFGDAGDACLTTGALDYSARSTTSRGLVILQVALNSTAAASGPNCKVGVYRDAMANQVGGLLHIEDDENTFTSVAYVTGLTAASHEFAVHGESMGSTAGECDPESDPNGMRLIYIDLGPEYS